MKKWMIVVIVLVIVALCYTELSNKEKKQEDSQANEVSKANKKVKDEAASNATQHDHARGEEFSSDAGKPVTITLPADYFEDLTDDEILETVESEGATNIKIAEDHSVTYSIGQAQYKTALTEMEQSLTNMRSTITNSKDYPSIEAISTNADFTNIIVKVNRKDFDNSYDSVAILSLVMSATYYQVYQGNTDYKIVVHYVDTKSNSEYKTATYPEE